MGWRGIPREKVVVAHVIRVMGIHQTYHSGFHSVLVVAVREACLDDTYINCFCCFVCFFTYCRFVQFHGSNCPSLLCIVRNHSLKICSLIYVCLHAYLKWYASLFANLHRASIV